MSVNRIKMERRRDEMVMEWSEQRERERERDHESVLYRNEKDEIRE